MSSASRYDYQFDPDDDSTPAQICRLVGSEKRVLELGCAAGAMSVVLTRHYQCQLIGLEADPAAAEAARAQGIDARVADLESPDWAAGLADAAFDAILAADVLEHLHDPLACLRQLRRLLSPRGHLIVSVPNIAHSGVLAALLCDAFPYRDTGLLDRTHVHFFTRDSLRQMLLQAGFAVTQASTADTGPHHPEFAAYWDALPPPLRQHLAGNPAGRAYQIIMRATPSDAVADPRPEPPTAAQAAWLRTWGQIPFAEIDALNGQLNALREALQTAATERDQLAERLDAMQRSRSWRWTAFLRRGRG
ncbi:class I SAM-dependent methyltransferase [Castellaniella hirudinis]|uniref:class I SAM-dependent methyltransferase n=1 Tax=Castellaniella hirudinis TaxID=1144617 RepID=UPI0039C1B06F